MSFYFAPDGNLGGLLPSRECPLCGRLRGLFESWGRNTTKRFSMRCVACQTSQEITEKEFRNMPDPILQPTGYACHRCGKDLTTFSLHDGWCQDCGQAVAFRGKTKPPRM